MCSTLKKLTGFAIFSVAALAGMAASATLALQLTGSSEADARPAPAAASDAHLVSAKRAARGAPVQPSLPRGEDRGRPAPRVGRPEHARGHPARGAELDRDQRPPARRAPPHEEERNARAAVPLALEASIEDDRRTSGCSGRERTAGSSRSGSIRNNRVNTQLRSLAGGSTHRSAWPTSGCSRLRLAGRQVDEAAGERVRFLLPQRRAVDRARAPRGSRRGTPRRPASSARPPRERRTANPSAEPRPSGGS